MRHITLSRQLECVLLLAAAATLPGFAKDETVGRLDRAATVLNNMEKGHGLRPDQIAGADCIAVIPGFKKGAAVIGIGFGRGFIACRTDNGWSAPGAVTLESGSLGVQIGGEALNIVILSRDKEKRAKLLSDRFAIGDDASAAWGNGKSAHQDSDAKILFLGQTSGAFAGFGLDGATLKTDDSGNKALYGKPVSNAAVVAGEVTTPAAAQPLIAALSTQSR
jgi:lipid-binding SYLF domain-containing protein